MLLTNYCLCMLHKNYLGQIKAKMVKLEFDEY